MIELRDFRRAPFRLEARDLSWLEDTFAAMSMKEKIAQLFVVLGIENCVENLDRLTELGIGGIYRRARTPARTLQADAAHMQSRSRVPLFVCGDLELGAEGSIGMAEGTAFPNQMAVGATGDPKWAERLAIIAAREGRAVGYNWSLSPVADLCLNRQNPIVSTRSFGSFPGRVSRMVSAYIRALQREGIAACLKHWPGDGADDRDQHFVTSVNPLSLAEWERTYGVVYRKAIRSGVKTIMSAHIAFPGLPGAGMTPASLSSELNSGLLRGRLGFNGLILSDASTMGGLTSHGRRRDLVPRLIAHGCDMVLFPANVELEMSYVGDAIDDGRLSHERVDDAVLRVLALKASLKLHRPRRAARGLTATRRAEHERWARRCAERAVVLVKDEIKLLPLSPARHRRVLIAQQFPRQDRLGVAAPLELDRYLTEAGFTVEHFGPHVEVHPDFFDVMIYAAAEEGTIGRGPLELRWAELHGNFSRGNERYWHEIPTVFISFGSPFHVREAPLCPVFVNAFSPVRDMQIAVVKALMGQQPFAGRSPVDLRGMT